MRTTRRDFITQTSLAAAGTILAGCATAKPVRALSPNEKLNLGVIGVAGRGGENLDGVKTENIVALCDVDRTRLEAAGSKFPGAKRYTDFRKMLEQGDLDGVVVSTPDHSHAVIAIAALQSGRHVYCEKPLTHTISELRRLETVARKSGLVTQTGNQIHATENYRRVVELVQSGILGPVREVHHWAGSVWDPKPFPAPKAPPATLDYDNWIGPIPPVTYSEEWVHFNWRRWWLFGGGTLTDFCCHHMDLSFWALELTQPTVIEAQGPAVDPHCVAKELKVRYEFPARGTKPAVTMHWHSGGSRPSIPGLPDLTKWGGGTVFVGEKGMLLADYGRHLLFPEDRFPAASLPPTALPKPVEHHQEWIRACKGENMALPQFAKWGRTNSPFSYGALLTEAGILGNIAFRTGRRIEWDAVRLKAKGVPEADRYIHHEYRPGWRLG